MISTGRWALLAVLGAAIVGCGGNSSSNNTEEETGVALEIFGSGDSSPVLLRQLGAKLTVDGSVGVSEGDTLATVYRDPEYIFIEGDASDTDEFEEDQPDQFLEVSFLPQYLNATFDTISFNLNHSDGSYGVDFAVYATPRSEGDEPLWRYSDMIDWCINIEENVELELADIFPDDFDFDFNTDIDPEYDEAPTELEAARSWAPTSDTRFLTCPLATSVGRWLGRKVVDDSDDPDNPANTIQNIVYDEYRTYFEYLKCEEDGGDDCNETSKPNESSLATAILLDSAIVTELEEPDTDEADFEIEIELNMNEFSVVSDPFVYQLTVKTADLN